MKNHWRKLCALMPDVIEKNAFRNFFKIEHRKLQTNNPLNITSNLTKQQALRTLQEEYKLNTLVETGTYLGDTLFALYSYFDHLYSIELSDLYFKKAQQRFRNYKKIQLLNGDSGKELKKLVQQLNVPVLFWLDGHYSGGLTAMGDKECPVFEELDSIFSSSLPHVIVIDDARLFVGKNDYPTIEELGHYVAKYKSNYSLSIENDSIRLLPG